MHHCSTIRLHIIFFETVRNLFAAARYCKAADTAKVEACLDEAFVCNVGVERGCIFYTGKDVVLLQRLCKPKSYCPSY
jgi:hypothetical protein